MSEKRQTPMQELIAELKEAKANESCASLSIEDGYDKAIQIAESKLEKERAVVEKAFSSGWDDGVDVGFKGSGTFNEDYFNETFKTEE